MCRGTNVLGKPNTSEWSRSVAVGERGENAGGVGGKLPGGVIQPAKDEHAVGQLILGTRFLPYRKQNICMLFGKRSEIYTMGHLF